MREMKDSGVEWIGEIPENWKVSKIKHHFNIGSGTTPKSDIPEFWDGDIVWITPADFKTDDIRVRISNLLEIKPYRYRLVRCGEFTAFYL